MVRAFAASDGLLRQGGHVQGRAGKRPGQREILLTRTVIALVAIFLAIATFSVFVQFTVGRGEQLERAEKALALAARMIANEMAARSLREGATAPTDLSASLTPSLGHANEPGQRFLLVDRGGAIRAASDRRATPGQSANWLFADPFDFSRLDRRGRVARLTLADGTLASVSLYEDAAIGGAVLALQPVDDELAPWRQRAYALAAVLLAFGAVTIALALAFHTQRRRAVFAGTSAAAMRSQFEIALGYGRCGLWDWSLATGQVVWSDSMRRMLGLGAEPVTQASIAARLHPEDRDLFEVLGGAEEAGELDRLFRMSHAAEGWVWLRMRAIRLPDPEGGERLLGIVMDVTREREAEAEIHRADTRLRDAIESISEAFVLWDENNRLVLCNSKYQSFHGLPAEIMRRGANYTSVMSAARAPSVLIEIDRGTEPATGARCYEAQFQDGTWLLISERRTRDGGFVSVGTDITARKRQEEQLVENERQLRVTITDLGTSREAFRQQASQLAELADRYLEQKAEAICANRAKAEFLANMNHEIRTPLNHIIGFAEMIESEMFGPAGSPRYLEYARDIRLSGANLMALISDILDMARIEAGRVRLERAPTAIGQLLADAAREVALSAVEKNIALELEPDTEELAGQRQVLVDPNAVSQALAHLMRNGIRLSPAGGRVSVRARLAGDFVNIFIADRGCHLTEGEIGTMVDPFGHIDGMLEDGCKGSGLNVPIARALIELHGGTMRLKSSPQFGSLVMVRLPIGPELTLAANAA